MLVSPKWQTMWMESQHCSKSIMNVNLPSQQTKKVLEDLRTNCCSSNKLVQLEALKCWGMWINNQKNDDWKLNTVCFMAVRPLITKKMQPLHKDVDIFKLKLSLMWALLVKVQNIMQLEGPQYILEVFLQSCLSWLSSTNGEGCENEISVLIFQLLFSILQNETVSDWDTELFTPLTTDILQVRKVFHTLADKFLNIFVHWRKVPDKIIFLKLWKYFLEHCELSCEHIPIPLWHKIFKLADQICSEKNEPVKERLAFLHSCATVLKSVLSSSKFIDFGNLLTTPCEALFKKLVELCTMECGDNCDLEMFFHSKEISEVLSVKSVAIGCFDLCITVLDVLEEFSMKDLLWGVWCGLVYCYKVHLMNVGRSKLTKVEMKFYRKLRGVAVNFELDREELHKDCISEVERHIGYLNINCLRPSVFETLRIDGNEMEKRNLDVCPLERPSLSVFSLPTGHMTPVALYKKRVSLRTINFDPHFVEDVLKKVEFNFKNSALDFPFLFLKSLRPLDVSIHFRVSLNGEQNLNVTLTCIDSKPLLPVPECVLPKKNALVPYEKRNERERNEEKKKKKRKVEEEAEEETVSTPNTRSRRKAEEEKRKELESQRRKTRKSFEDLVQEIVRKNKERKTEKNSKRRSPIFAKRNKRKGEKTNEEKPKEKITRNEKTSTSDRKLRQPKKEEEKTEKVKNKSFKTDGKLENYFKVITKKSWNETKKEKKKPQKGKKGQEKKRENNCCNSEKEEGEKKGEIGWRQTSLKTMMSRRNKTEKMKVEMRTRSKMAMDEKPKKDSKITESPVTKFSPFKEVFHDHEYAKIEPQDLETFERVLHAQREKAVNKNELKPIKEEPEPVAEESTTVLELPKSKTEEEKPSEKNTEEPEPPTAIPEKEKELEDKPMEVENSITLIEEERLKDSIEPPIENKIPEPDVTTEEPLEALESNNDFEDCTRGKKRPWAMKEEKPSKRLKLEEEDSQEEKLPLEVTEKENLEERQTRAMSPVKRVELGGKTNGMISSRALRMIALVPESTKGSQMQWEASSRVEVLKCKKAPNVDKSSRASKMLALLSESVVEVEEPDEGDEICRKEVTTTPNVKTPVSSLKSPMSVKKRRSIRFDDAKNETVLYQTDMPPSQVHEEKEKCRRVVNKPIVC